MTFSHSRSSLNSSVSFCQIVSKFFSPVMHMNLHLVEASLTSSPWISRPHLCVTLWWAAVWASARASHVCWIWPRSCSDRGNWGRVKHQITTMRLIEAQTLFLEVPLRVLVESTSKVGRSAGYFGSVSIFIEGNWSNFLFRRVLILDDALF